MDDRIWARIKKMKKRQVILTLVLIHFCLTMVWFICRKRWAFPNRTFLTSMAIYSFTISGILYRIFLKEIRREGNGYSEYKKWVVKIFGPVLMVVFIWGITTKPIAYLFGKTANNYHTEIVTVIGKAKGVGRGQPCYYEYYLKEYPFPIWNPLCLEEKFWNKGNSGSKIQLIGRQNYIAFYIDSVRFVGNP